MKAPNPRLVPKNTRMGKPIRANAGIEAEYKKRLQELIDAMFASLNWWLGAEYKRQQEKILAYDAAAPWWRRTLDRLPAFDASPARGMQQVLRQRMRQWMRTFDEDAAKLATWFANRANTSATAATSASIADVAGFAVKFKPTRAMNNAMQSLVAENVSLIRSLPQDAFAKLEGMVMRSVRSGRDLAGLAADIEKTFEVTRSRARTIAHDQNNKATEALSSVRMKSVGITQAVWIHSGRGLHPRETHVAMHGKPFDLSGPEAGLYDSSVQQRVMPGELVNCDCTKAPLVPAFSQGPADLATVEAAAERIRQADEAARRAKNA